jgi:porphobilinogen synthase
VGITIPSQESTELGKFPFDRPRRLRRTTAIRALVQEHRISPSDLVLPLFVCEGTDVRRPISSMPGQYNWSIDRLVPEVAMLGKLGIHAVMLFGIPDAKDDCGSDNFDPEGIVPRAIRAIKDANPEIIVISDMCFCEYTDHGHCGILQGGTVDNDPTLPLLAQAAVAYARAGADVIAPSDMMDGRIGYIRRALDAEGHTAAAIVSYAAKYASAFYGPFRDAAGSTPQLGDRRGYQMDPPNVREAVREALADIDEGADLVMVKPGLPYLDVIRAIRERVDVPVVAYQVSGEFAMLHAAADRGWVDLPRAMMETSISLRRAGADLLITYFAEDAARWIAEEGA